MSFLSYCLEKVGLLWWRSNPSTDQCPLLNLTGLLSKESSNLIPHGSFREVRKCTYTTSDHGDLEVAVKPIMIDVTDDDSKARITQKLLDYFRARMQLQHENILPLLGFSDDFGQLPAMVSPWMHDGSLITICSEQKWTIEHKFEILQQVAAAISYLHSKDVVHGDLTANNILIDSDGNARVADYGILIMRSELSGTSYVGSINVRWAAPELFEALENKESSTSPTPASDIYSFGCLMLQVMTGQQPYADARNDDQVTDLIGKGKKPTRPLSPRIADCLWEVIDRCWNDVERRPSADQVVGFLHEITLDKLSEK